MQKNQKRAMPVLLLAILIDLICNGIIVPIVPQLLANPGSPYYLLPSYVPIQYSYIVLGLLIAIYPIFLFFSTPILGEYSDFLGRKKILSMALVGTAFSLCLFAGGVMLKSLAILFIARIIGGIVGGYLSVAQAAIADITPPEKRSTQFGLIGAAYGVGFIIGPVVGGLLSDPALVSWFNASTPFWFAGALSLLNAGLVWTLFLETRQFTEQPLKITWHKAVKDVIHAYGIKEVRPVFITNFLFQAGLALCATFFSVFLISEYGFDQVSVGYYIGYAGIWVIISQGVLLRILAKRFDEIALLRFFLLTGSIAIIAYYIPDQVIGLLIVGAFFALTNGINMAALPSLASRRSPSENQGEILGINGSVQALAQAVPPIVAGLLAAEIAPGAPVYIGGAIIGLAWIVFMVFVRRN